MITHQIFVENTKCSGCMKSIKTALLKNKGVTAVKINKEDDKVCVTGIAIEKEIMVSQLLSLDYPEKGNNSLLSKVKSFVSCAVGTNTYYFKNRKLLWRQSGVVPNAGLINIIK